MARDLRHAFRALRRSPGFSAVAILTFALGIAATTGVYSAVDGLLLQPLPFPDADRLVFVGQTGVEPAAQAYVTSRYTLDLVAETSETLVDVATFNIWEATLTGVGEPSRLSGAVVTPAYFTALGHQPIVGRTFRAEDDAEGAPRRVVISHRLWRTRFNAEAGVIGRLIDLDGNPYEIIGVMPAGFESPDEYAFTSHLRSRPDIWRAFRSTNSGGPRSRSYRGIARLAPGASLAEARAEMELIGQRIGMEHEGWGDENRIAVLPLKEQFVAPLRPVLGVLLGAVALVLLAGCANVMNLTLARGLGREHDLRVRSAVGAGRGALLSLVAMEILLLGAAGGAAGILLGHLGIDAFVAAAPDDLPRLEGIRLDAGTLGVTLGITFAAALVAGVVPGLRLLWGRGRIAGPASPRGATGSRSYRKTLAVFATSQVALAILLLIGAGLLLRSFLKLTDLDPGYDPNGVALGQVDFSLSRYGSAAERLRFIDEVFERLDADPAVASAGLVTSVPQHGLNNFGFGIGIPALGMDNSAGAWAGFRGIDDDYLSTLGIELLRGRAPSRTEAVADEDGDPLPATVAVNQEFVDRFLGDLEPIGARLSLSGIGMGEVEIVGVAANTKYGWLGDADEPEIYVPYTGRLFTVFILARARDGEADAVRDSLQRSVQEIDPLLPMDTLFSLDGLLASSLAGARATTFLMGSLAFFALLLSGIGIYGVIAHGVARRQREFGVRMALGASGSAVRRMVLRQGTGIAIVGAAVGLTLAWAASRAIESLLFGVTTHDPLTYAGVAVVLTALAVAATWVPARAATRVDPITTLREE